MKDIKFTFFIQIAVELSERMNMVKNLRIKYESLV